MLTRDGAAVRSSGNQVDVEAFHDECGEGKADDGEEGGGAEGGPEPGAVAEQVGHEEEHGEGGDDVPESVVGVVGDFFGGLVFEVEPDHGDDGDEGEGGDEGTEFVGALGDLGDGDDDEGGDGVFGDEEGHGFG